MTETDTTTRPSPDRPSSSNRQLELQALAVVAVTVVANGLLLAPLPLELRLVGGLALFVGLPGHLFVQAVFTGPGPTTLERRLLAVAAGYVLAISMMLGLYVLFRPLQVFQLLIGANALNVGLLVGALARRADLGLPLTRLGWPVLLVLAVAAPLRLLGLSLSEFWGDEAKVVLRAMALLQGVPDALIAHRKPPGEVLITAAFSGGLGAITEQTARLPVALAGVVGVLAVYHLGGVLFGARTGLVAALVLAVTGYFVAFGRMLQYPSLALLLETLAVLCLSRFACRSSAQPGYAVTGALLLAGSALTAISAVFLLPVAAVALWPRVFGPARAPWREMVVWFWPLALLVPGMALVYIVLPSGPGDSLSLTENFSTYMQYRMGENRPYFNLERFLLSVNHYNSGLYALVVLGGGSIVLLEPLYESFREATRRLRVHFLGVAAFAWLALDVQNLGIALLIASVLGLVYSSPGRSPSWKLALAWLAGPLFAHLFLVRLVGTHWREILPGLLLLLAAAAVGLYARLANSRVRLVTLLAGVMFLAANAHYVYVAWLQPWPEYQLMYPVYRHPLDWSNQPVPRGGSILGATHHHGWKAVGVLMAQGDLPRQYATSVRPEAAWYLRSVRLCREVAQLVIRTPNSPRDRRIVETSEPLPGFFLVGRTYAEGRPGLALLTREPRPGGPLVYQADEYEREFDRRLSSPWAPVGRLYWPLVNAESACPHEASPGAADEPGADPEP